VAVHGSGGASQRDNVSRERVAQAAPDGGANFSRHLFPNGHARGAARSRLHGNALAFDSRVALIRRRAAAVVFLGIFLGAEAYKDHGYSDTFLTSTPVSLKKEKGPAMVLSRGLFAALNRLLLLFAGVYFGVDTDAHCLQRF
jgi:hypothetical protein